jgi:hypothetical protein
MFLTSFLFRFHQIRKKECLEYSANCETKRDIQTEETLRLEIVGCCGTDTSTQTAQALCKQWDSVRYVCVPHYTQTGADHYRYTRTQM